MLISINTGFVSKTALAEGEQTSNTDDHITKEINTLIAKNSIFDVPFEKNDSRYSPKLDDVLVELVTAKEEDKLEEYAKIRGIRLKEGTIFVTMKSLPDQMNTAKEVALKAEATLLAEYKNLQDIIIPVNNLNDLAQHESIQYIELPIPEVPEELYSQGREKIEADDWYDEGYNGSGVKIGILDIGFSGWNTLPSGELPADVSTNWSAFIGGPGNENHGTACAEIIHDIAPGAQLFLANYASSAEKIAAVGWFITQGVDIISCSTSLPAYGPGDGTGILNDLVQTADTSGIIWVQSAGNYAEQHWWGDFDDPTTNRWLNFTDTDESVDINASLNQEIQIRLNWNDPWGGSNNDYDLFLYDKDGNIVSYSLRVQDGDANDTPYESLNYTANYSGLYHIKVLRGLTASSNKNLHIFSLNSDLEEYQVSSRSLSVPADSAHAITVGSVYHTYPDTIASYSSRGPTTDDRIKPDIVAPTYVQTNMISPFSGTSAATPHVAGAAALIMARYPSYNKTSIINCLYSNTIDVDPAGKDNTWGWGKLRLPMYDLTLSSNYGGSVTAPGEGTFSYVNPTNVDLIASPDQYGEFAYWQSGSGYYVPDPNTASTSIYMNQDYKVRAMFSYDSSGPTVTIYNTYHQYPCCHYLYNIPYFGFRASDNSSIFSYILDQYENTQPDDIPDNVNYMSGENLFYKTYSAHEDGTWWFHVKAYGNDTWGPQYDFQINIQSVTISSTTHPNQYQWYENNDPQFSWTSIDPRGTPQGYHIEINQTQDDNLSETVNYYSNNTSYSDIDNGIWWLHVKPKDYNGLWGNTAHYKVMIDAYEPPPTYIINANVSGSGGNVTPSYQSVEQGNNADYIYYTPAQGYKLDYMTDNGVPTTPTTSTYHSITNIQGNHNLIFYFTLVTHTLTTTSSSGGNVTAPGEGPFDNYSYGQIVTIIATPDEHHHFTCWSGDNSTIDNPLSSNTTINMTGDFSITANFDIDTYTVTASVNGTGGSVDPYSQQVTYNDTAYVDIDTDPLYTIISITDNGQQVSVSDPYIVSNVTENHSIVVSIALYQRQVTAGVSGGNGSVTPGNQWVDIGTVAAVYMTPDEGYHISGIIDNGQLVTAVNPYIIEEVFVNHSLNVIFSNVFELRNPVYEITLDASKIDSNLTHFPVLIHLSNSCGQNEQDLTGIFDEVGDNSKKIAVTQADKNTQLFVEVESWNATSEEAWLWVSGDNWTLSSSENTTLFLYCDNDMPDNTQFVGVAGSTPGQAVWDENFIMVQHMGNGANSTVTDSTANGNTGAKKSLTEPDQNNSLIGQTQTYDGTDDLITLNDNPSLHSSSAVTVEALTNMLQPVVNYETIAGQWDTGASQREWMLCGYPADYDRLCFYASNDGTWNPGHQYAIQSNDYIIDGSLHLFAATWDAGTGQLYLDGSPISQSAVYSGITTLHNSTAKFGIGAGQSSGSGQRHISGNMTELRVSDIARSAAWMKATWYSSMDDLVRYDKVLVGETGTEQEEATGDWIVVSVNLDMIRDSLTGENLTDTVISSYTANLSYMYAPPDGIEILDIKAGDSPFDNPSKTISNNNPGEDCALFWQSAANGTVPAITMARYVPRLIGCCTDTYDVTLNITSILASENEVIYQEFPIVDRYQRGDADGNGIIDMDDATLCALRYLTQIPVDSINAVNAAGAVHDGPSGDKVLIDDSYVCAMYYLGMFDCYFQYTGKSGSSYESFTGGSISVQAGKQEITEEKLTVIPLVIKGIPKDSVGLGAYALAVNYDPKSTDIVDILPGKDCFTDKPIYNMVKEKGILRLAGLHPAIPAATGDVIVAYLVIKTDDPKFDASGLTIKIMELVDGFGEKIDIKDVTESKEELIKQ
ncbi:MAG: S8 family serine peptidase [Dehalococcoidales bacterium]|nr:S8 family serine peptidase [Dehalococcoidales bacterium]